MLWNKTAHQWTLEPDDIRPWVNVEQVFGSEERATLELNKIADTVHNYILSFGASGDVVLKDYMAFSSDEVKYHIKRALIAQTLAHIESGLNELKNQAGVNIETGQAIPQSLLLSHSLCPEAKNWLLKACHGEFKLCYAGKYWHEMQFGDYERLDF